MPEPNPPSILCHPDGRKSCGACCGMYNRRSSERLETLQRLGARTAAYHRDADVGDPASLRAFRTRWEVIGSDAKLIEDLPNCPFLGMLDPDRGAQSKVGCLVHPLQNGGVDGRDCGVYDRFICDDYLCAAHEVLRPIEAWLVVEAIDDSYQYGLVITDPLFVRQLFEQSARLNGAMPSAGRVMADGAAAAAADYFELKVDWPYRAPDGIFGQVEAGDGLDTPRRGGPSEVLGVEPDAWESILRCLGTVCSNLDELLDARATVDRAVAKFAAKVDL